MAKEVYDRVSKRRKTSELRDVYLRHGINLTRYSTHEARKLQDILDTANVQIRGIISKAKAVETKEKYRRIAADIRRVSNELTEKLDRQIEFDFKELAGEESRFVENAMRSVGVKADFELPAPQKIWAAASFDTYDGYRKKETYETYLNTLGDNVFKTWDANVRAGYLAGLTAQQINRAVLGSVKDMEPGQMKDLRNSLEMNTKTMVAHLAEKARDETYRKNSSLFSGFRYVGTLDSRCCLECSVLDGKFFEGSEVPTEPEMPQHPRCRCLWLPVIKGMEDEFDEDDERASVDGPVPASWTYQDWLKTQDDKTILDILGPTRYGLYKEGMPITSFVADGSVLSLKKMIEKEGLELFGGGLKDKSWQVQKAYSDTYYNSIRNRSEPTDIDKIAKNTDFSVNDIQAIRDHVFIDEHDLGDGKIGRFASDWQIAQAWQRMEQGWEGNGMKKYRDCDILLLKHELEELTIMAKYGYNAWEAHGLATKKYQWSKAIKELG